MPSPTTFADTAVFLRRCADIIDDDEYEVVHRILLGETPADLRRWADEIEHGREVQGQRLAIVLAIDAVIYIAIGMLAGALLW